MAFGPIAWLFARVGVQVVPPNTAQVNTALAQTQKSWQRAANNLTNAGFKLSFALSAPIISGTKKAITAFAAYEREMKKIENLTETTKQQAQVWGRELLDLAPKLGKAPTELAEALYYVASAGQTGSRAMDIVMASAKGSAIGLGSVAQVAKVTTAAVNAFAKDNLSASRAVDVLAANIKEGALETDALATSIGRVIPIAAAVGATWEDTAAFLAQASRTGANAEQVITSLRGILNSLMKPSAEAIAVLQQVATPFDTISSGADQAAGALEKVGISASDLQDIIKGQGLGATLTLISNALGADNEIIAKVLPNVRALTGYFSVLGQEAGSYERVSRAINASNGLVEESFSNVKTSMAQVMAELSATIDVAWIRIGESIAPTVRQLIKLIEPLIDAIGRLSKGFATLTPTLQKIVLLFLLFSAVLFPLLTVLGFVASGITSLVGIPLAGTLFGWGLAFVAVGIAATALFAALGGFSNVSPLEEAGKATTDIAVKMQTDLTTLSQEGLARLQELQQGYADHVKKIEMLSWTKPLFGSPTKEWEARWDEAERQAKESSKNIANFMLQEKAGMSFLPEEMFTEDASAGMSLMPSAIVESYIDAAKKLDLQRQGWSDIMVASSGYADFLQTRFKDIVAEAMIFPGIDVAKAAFQELEKQLEVLRKTPGKLANLDAQTIQEIKKLLQQATDEGLSEGFKAAYQELPQLDLMQELFPDTNVGKQFGDRMRKMIEFVLGQGGTPSIDRLIKIRVALDDASVREMNGVLDDIANRQMPNAVSMFEMFGEVPDYGSMLSDLQGAVAKHLAGGFKIGSSQWEKISRTRSMLVAKELETALIEVAGKGTVAKALSDIFPNASVIEPELAALKQVFAGLTVEKIAKMDPAKLAEMGKRYHVLNASLDDLNTELDKETYLSTFLGTSYDAMGSSIAKVQAEIRRLVDDGAGIEENAASIAALEWQLGELVSTTSEADNAMLDFLAGARQFGPAFGSQIGVALDSFNKKLQQIDSTTKGTASYIYNLENAVIEFASSITGESLDQLKQFAKSMAELTRPGLMFDKGFAVPKGMVDAQQEIAAIEIEIRGLIEAVTELKRFETLIPGSWVGSESVLAIIRGLMERLAALEQRKSKLDATIDNIDTWQKYQDAIKVLDGQLRGMGNTFGYQAERVSLLESTIRTLLQQTKGELTPQIRQLIKEWEHWRVISFDLGTELEQLVYAGNQLGTTFDLVSEVTDTLSSKMKTLGFIDTPGAREEFALLSNLLVELAQDANFLGRQLSQIADDVDVEAIVSLRFENGVQVTKELLDIRKAVMTVEKALENARKTLESLEVDPNKREEWERQKEAVTALSDELYKLQAREASAAAVFKFDIDWQTNINKMHAFGASFDYVSAQIGVVDALLEDALRPGSTISEVDTEKLLDKKALLETTQFVQDRFQDMADAISNSMAQAVEGFAQGTLSMEEFWQKMVDAILLNWAQATIKIAVDWVATQVKMAVANAILGNATKAASAGLIATQEATSATLFSIKSAELDSYGLIEAGKLVAAEGRQGAELAGQTATSAATVGEKIWEGMVWVGTEATKLASAAATFAVAIPGTLLLAGAMAVFAIATLAAAGAMLALDFATGIFAVLLPVLTAIMSTVSSILVPAFFKLAAATAALAVAAIAAGYGYAALAMAMAASAVAYIPIIGPALAVVAAAAVGGIILAMLAGMAGMAFAEKGAIVPGDMPLYAHKGEMVLPANISRGLQDIIASRNATYYGDDERRAQPVVVNFNPTVNAIDQKGVRQFFREYGNEMVTEVGRQARGFNTNIFPLPRKV